MQNQKSVMARCLCEKVKFEFSVESAEFDVCHCSMCRKWAGGPGFGVNASSALKITGEENIHVYQSSDWAERAFCKNCGTHVFYRLKDKSFTNVPLGIIDNNQDFKFNLQIFVDSKPANYTFADQTKNMTEAQVLAAFTNKG